MIVVAVCVGLFVWALVGAFTGEVILHTPKTGVLEGLVAGVWAAWPIFHQGRVGRYNFLHPVPRRYKVPLKHAFSKIRQIIGEKNYNFGDKWHVSTADTMQRRITATLRFTEEESRGFDGTNIGNIQHRTQRVQRLLELDVQMKEEPGDLTVIQFDFVPRVEGVAWHACDTIIAGVVNDTEAALGPGEDAGNPADTRLPAPPWWLLGVTAFGLLALFGDIMKAVFGS
jgi:hypothetical protein